MYDVHIEVESLVYIYVYVGSRTIFSPVVKTSIHTFSCLGVLEVPHQTAVREVPGSISDSGNAFNGFFCVFCFYVKRFGFPILSRRKLNFAHVQP